MGMITKPDLVIKEGKDGDGDFRYDLYERVVTLCDSELCTQDYDHPVASILPWNPNDLQNTRWYLCNGDSDVGFFIDESSAWKVYKRFRKLYRRCHPLGINGPSYVSRHYSTPLSSV